MKKINLLDRNFGSLVVLREAPRSPDGKVMWLCKCACGSEKPVRSADLQFGRTKSCGCRLGAKKKGPLSIDARERLNAAKEARTSERAKALTDIDWRQHFSYEAATGRLLWKVKRPGPQTQIGREAGCIKHDGRYRSFVLYHKRFLTHRVIWELVNGPIADGMCIDHIDGDGLNNRLQNLRVTTLSINQRNRRVGKNNRTGVNGVNHTKSGYAVQCGTHYIGHFMSLEAATAARRAAEPKYGYLTNDRKA